MEDSNANLHLILIAKKNKELRYFPPNVVVISGVENEVQGLVTPAIQDTDSTQEEHEHDSLGTFPFLFPFV